MLSSEADSRPSELADLGRALGTSHHVASFLEKLENQVPGEARKTDDRLKRCQQSGNRHDRLDDLSQSSHCVYRQVVPQWGCIFRAKIAGPAVGRSSSVRRPLHGRLKELRSPSLQKRLFPRQLALPPRFR